MTDPRFDLAVVGIGYVGLPLAVAAAGAGLQVVGYDIDCDTVASLAAGQSHVEDVVADDLVKALETGFTPSCDEAVLGEAANVSICVPTPLENGLPDLGAVRSAAHAIGERLHPGMLVVLESTTYPGTTEDVLRPILEQGSGLVAGRDFHLAYSPERIDPGNTQYTIVTTPKLVAGLDEASTARAAALYGSFCSEVVPLARPAEAEMAKLLENTYRHVNIALVNEMAIFCRELGIDIFEVIRGAATKPFGFQEFRPGPGVGGHCIPIDPNYLSYKVRQLGYQFRFVELAQEINGRMPAYVAERVVQVLNDRRLPVNGARILLLGVAYKPGVGDTRETPARPVARRLLAMGAEVSYCDPHVAEFTVDGEAIPKVDDSIAAATGADLVVVLTPHAEFDLDAVVAAAPAALDTRGVAGPGAEGL